MAKTSLEIYKRETAIYEVIEEQQRRLMKLVKKIPEMNNMERMYEIRLESIKQKIVERIILEEIERVHFYSTDFRDRIKKEELQKLKKEAKKRLDDDFGSMGYYYNKSYLESIDDLKLKVKEANDENNLYKMMVLKKEW